MKKTIFKGEVNGVKFDNVADYNKAITAAIENNTLISANSSTEVVEEECGHQEACQCCGKAQCDCECCDEEMLTLYPYMDLDDPYYLDLLVTDDSEVNFEARCEVANVFEEAKNVIEEFLNDESVDIEIKHEYLDDIKEIIKDIKKDSNNNIEGLDRIQVKKQKLIKTFEEQEKKFNEEMKVLEEKQMILNDANEMIDIFTDFYVGVKEKVEDHLGVKSSGCYRKCADALENTKTEVVETEPQKEIDLSGDLTKSLQSLITAVFGDLTKTRNKLK